MRIALFVTCFNDTLYPGTGKAVVTLLERLGHEVVFPRRTDLLWPDALQHRVRPGVRPPRQRIC
jgi:Fe-S oxidoreductase